MELKGELTSEQREDLKNLLLEFKKVNEGHEHSMKISEIKLLPPAENARLWKYVEHISRLVAMYPNHLKTFRKIATNMGLLVPDLVEEAVQEMTVWVYRYTWRTYNPDFKEKSEAKVFSDANFGFTNWVHQYINESQVAFLSGEIKKELEDNPNPCGHKVCNLNIN